MWYSSKPGSAAGDKTRTDAKSPREPELRCAGEDAAPKRARRLSRIAEVAAAGLLRNRRVGRRTSTAPRTHDTLGANMHARLSFRFALPAGGEGGAR